MKTNKLGDGHVLPLFLSSLPTILLLVPPFVDLAAPTSQYHPLFSPSVLFSLLHIYFPLRNNYNPQVSP